MNYPLDDGDLEDFEIECLYHSARFDIRDGSAKCLPATEPIRTYETKIKDNKVFIEIS